MVAELVSGAVQTRYLYGINLICSIAGTTTKYYLYNAHGDVVQLASSTGAVIKTYRYDAFGVEVSPDANDTNPFRYCGEYFDKETGTYYLRARYYDPSIGRFISQDGMEYIEGIDPLSLNLYTYCKSNPVRYNDSTGHRYDDMTPEQWFNYQENLENHPFCYDWTGQYVTTEFENKVVEICNKLQMNPDYLMAIMAFESGGINPTARNNSSGATGLIQFMPSTARRLGTTTADLAKMSAVDQLDYVYEYFKPYTGKIHNIEDAYMAVFLPIAVGKKNDFVLGIKDSKDNLAKNLTYGAVYRQNSGLDVNKDGIITKQEAAQKVRDKRKDYRYETF